MNRCAVDHDGGAVGPRRSRVSGACVGRKGRSGISHNDEVVDAILAPVWSTLATTIERSTPWDAGQSRAQSHPLHRP